MANRQSPNLNDADHDRCNVTAATALTLTRVFGNSPGFWLNVQRRSEPLESRHASKEQADIERVKPTRSYVV